MFQQITDAQSSRCVTFFFLITLRKSRSAVVMIKTAHISIILSQEKISPEHSVDGSCQDE